MKKIFKSLTCLLCAMLCLMTFSACGKDDEDVYSNMTKSGFNNYLTDEDTTTKFSNYEANIIEKIDGNKTFEFNIKTRTLSGKSISIVSYKKGGINADVYIAQDKVYFKFKNSSGTVIETEKHALTLDFYATTNFTSVAAATVNEKIVLTEIRNYLTYIDAQSIYNKIKTDTTRLEADYSIKMSIKNSYDKYKLNYSAEEESGSFAEEYSIDAYLEFKNDTINNIEYVKKGKQINNTSFSDYELKITTTGYGSTISFPDELSDTEKYPVD